MLGALPVAHSPSLRRRHPAAPAPAMREVVDEFGRNHPRAANSMRIVSLCAQPDRNGFTPSACRSPRRGHRLLRLSARRAKEKEGRRPINPNLEEIAALHPDLVLLTKEINRLDTLRALDYTRQSLPTRRVPRNVDEILSNTQKLADLVGVPETGKSLTADLQLASPRFTPNSKPSRRAAFSFVVWAARSSPSAKTPSSPMRFAKPTPPVSWTLRKDWPQMNLEEVVRLQPDYLVFAASHAESAARDFEALSVLPGLAAPQCRAQSTFRRSSARRSIAPRRASFPPSKTSRASFIPPLFQDALAPEKPAAPVPPLSNPLASSPAHMTMNTPPFARELACAR